MVSLGIWKQYSATISIKSNCITLSLSCPDTSRVYSFDLTGRWWTGILDRISYRRGLDGKVVAKWITGSNLHERRWLSSEEATEVEGGIRREFSLIVSDLVAGQMEFAPTLSAIDIKTLQRIALYSIEESQKDIKQYHKVYKPVGILPPDQYMAVVLQATEGCSFNSCTFCTFYRDRPFRIKSLLEFKDHTDSVIAFLGDGLSLRRTIFLGDANALVTPMRRLVSMLEVTNTQFDVERMGGIYAFLDGFSGEKKSIEDYRKLKNLGVKRIYIGLESGNEDLLKFLKKPGTPSDALQAVRSIKAGGLSVGIILLLGAGGKMYIKNHIRDSVQLINQMDLDMDDLIYFSELVESEGMDYSRGAFRNEVTSLSPIERAQQAESIENGLKFPPTTGIPHISRYDIREFVY
jgi:hypothetical protein